MIVLNQTLLILCQEYASKITLIVTSSGSKPIFTTNTSYFPSNKYQEVTYINGDLQNENKNQYTFT